MQILLFNDKALTLCYNKHILHKFIRAQVNSFTSFVVMQRMLNVFGLRFENIQSGAAVLLENVAEYAADKFAICGFFFYYG